ncbi:NUDIX domain-containing protein [Pedobacter arcticus]|uniref:NUDIX domain-containing protein n=1 Tax=Pedobacter arcticus TaxID=752140 RepID=UPI0002F4CC2F|nr:NUDIX domain-containing protein [Pedobacter arcticus]
MINDKKFNFRVYGLLIDKGKNVLLSDEEEKGIRYSKFPGGGLEFGEGLIDALKREFIEECDLQVEIISHFYTTDFFVASAFGGGQLISVYYLVKALQNFQFKISTSEFDFEEQTSDSKQCFRLVNIKDLHEDSVTFPVDQHVVKLIKEQFL